METKSVSIHNTVVFPSLLNGIEVSPFMKLKQNDDTPGELPNIQLGELNVSETLYCSYCSTGFLDKQQQRQHYKLDWHRYNLKQHLAQKKTVSEEKFAQVADDVSSISGSESESDTETEPSSSDAERKAKEENERLDHLIARRSRVLFNNCAGQVISVHRCLLLNKKEEAASDKHLVNLVNNLSKKTAWLLIMLGGGHFAACIFKDSEPALHKTFHSYTVRSKQGGTQSSKDNKGSNPKSAGASLRRYNEQSFCQHIQDLMKSWSPDIIKCDYIFYRAVGRGNYNVLFNGSNAPLLRSDPRLRSIPFTTRRPTFSEVKRVYALLTTAFVYDSNEMFRAEFTPKKVDKDKGSDDTSKDDQNIEKKEKGSPKKVDRAKERPEVIRKLPSIILDLANETSESDDGSYSVHCTEEELIFTDNLKEFEDTVPTHMKKKRIKKKKEPFEEKETLTVEQLDFWKNIHGASEQNDVERMKEALQKSIETVTKEECYSVLNLKNIEGQTILHKMAIEKKGDIVRLLLLHGGDPCIKDKKAQTPYDVCPDKITRNVFRRFMGDFPDMYDYSKSHIPSALTEASEAEIAEKKRAARKVKRQKEKERKQVHEAQKQEEDEKKRFLALSDREKRALAAERRMIAAAGKTTPILARCFLCAEDITGKVPFEYEMYRFCSMVCLKAHRINVKKQTS